MKERKIKRFRENAARIDIRVPVIRCFRFYPSHVFQIDICPEELGNNVPVTVGLAGDIDSISQQVAF